MKWRFQLRLPVPVFVLFATACTVPASGTDRPPGPVVDRVDPSPGVPARGYEPGVVSLEVDGVVTCAGALVASDVVITARHCVSRLSEPIDCTEPRPPSLADIPPAAISIRTGDDASAATKRARGRAILVPMSEDVCEADLALLLLDSSVDTVAPFALRPTGVAPADHVRSVAWWGEGLVLRDHVVVLGTSARELRLDDPSYTFGAGGPALDEKTGELIGVASRIDRSAPTEVTIYVRTDAFPALFEQARLESAFGSPTTGSHLLKPHDAPADMGATCVSAKDCAAGDCVAIDRARYCSRGCGPHDRCPAEYRCERAEGGAAVCIKT